MKKLSVALFALLVFAGRAEAITLKSLLAIPTWNKPTKPFRIIDNVYYVGTAGLASYLIETSEGLILVDTVLPKGTKHIKKSIEDLGLGFKVSQIKYLLNTHAHIDHAGGFAELKEASGAQMVAGELDEPLLKSGYYPGLPKFSKLRFTPVKVDCPVREGDTVKLGNVTLTARETPGHSPGCTSWEFKVNDGGEPRSVLIFCSGDVGINRLVKRPTYPNIVDDYRKTFSRAKGMKVDILLEPHPEMYNMADKRDQLAGKKSARLDAEKCALPSNPFVNPCEFKSRTDALEKDFEQTLAMRRRVAVNWSPVAALQERKTVRPPQQCAR